MSDLEKRTWVYTQPPKDYEMSPCSCGNEETEWSEYAKHLWCGKCQKDFIPEHIGIFDGPIAVRACALMGIRFDRINLETGEIKVLDLDDCKFKPLEEQPQSTEVKP